MDTRTITLGEEAALPGAAEAKVAGVVLLFSGAGAAHNAISLEDGPVTLGRVGGAHALELADDRVSRQHARVEIVAGGVRVTDLGSRNGVFVDGERVRDPVLVHAPSIVRAGRSLLRVVPDVSPFLQGGVERSGGAVIGPTLRAVHEQIAAIAAAGDPAFFTGPSGAGKELAARVFHRATGRPGPLVAVNCATIPASLAERLLFGAKRGAYSGAVESADGYVQAAHGGTLFLDEIAELDPSVQPKLLRMLESREVTPLGASAPRSVDVRLCAATLKDIRSEVAAGRFRTDLYFRIGSLEKRIPSLVERMEELPFLLCDELSRVGAGLVPSVELVEACALRPWPGNVRDLLLAAREAARSAQRDGRELVHARDLAAGAGLPVGPASPEGAEDSAPPAPRDAPDPPGAATRASGDARDALARARGNVTAAARLLGWHRTQLRRWIAREGIDVTTFGNAPRRGDVRTRQAE